MLRHVYPFCLVHLVSDFFRKVDRFLLSWVNQVCVCVCLFVCACACVCVRFEFLPGKLVYPAPWLQLLS